MTRTHARTTKDSAEHRRGLFRVLAYFTVVGAVSGAINVRHARAEYRDEARIFGQQMLELAKATNHDVTKIVMNGQTVHLGTSSTPDAPSEVLARYEAYCKANDAQGPDFHDVAKSEARDAGTSPGTSAPASPPHHVDQNVLAKAGFASSTDEHGNGSVLCFVKGPRTKPTGKEAFESFLTTGELGAIGELRYAYASRAPRGRSLVLTVWTDSTFNLHDMIGREGTDVPGEDFPEAPRPPGSTRVMSARAADVPYGINLYRTASTPAAALAFYDGRMKAAGYVVYDPEWTEDEHAGLGRGYMKDGVVLSLSTSKVEDDTIVALGMAGAAAKRVERMAGP